MIEWSWMGLVYLEARGVRLLQLPGSRRSGQSTVEYALVGALVVIAAAAAMSALGNEIGSVFARITATLAGGAPSGH